MTFYAVEPHTMNMSGDGHYSTPDVMEFLEDQGCGYIFGLPGNARLGAIGHPWSESAAVRRVQSGRNKPRRFSQTGYQAKSWPRERKVIARVEATSKSSDIRFIVTDMGGRGELFYEKFYCARGRMENMIKDRKLYTKSDRTSRHRWEANQLRLFPHSGADLSGRGGCRRWIDNSFSRRRCSLDNFYRNPVQDREDDGNVHAAADQRLFALFMLARLGIPQGMADFPQGLDVPRWMLIMLPMGMFMDALSV